MPQFLQKFVKFLYTYWHHLNVGVPIKKSEIRFNYI
jgi:hypothetical protein